MRWAKVVLPTPASPASKITDPWPAAAPPPGAELRMLSSLPINSSPINAGPINPGPINPGPINPGPINPGPINPGPINPGPINSAPNSSGPTPHSAAQRRIAATDRSTSASSVDQLETEIRMAAWPRHVVPLIQHVPSRCTRSVTRRVRAS